MNRQTFQEARPVFFALNTISVRRDELCKTAFVFAYPRFDFQLCRSLAIIDLSSLSACSGMACALCFTPIQVFAAALLAAPKMRKLSISYSQNRDQLLTLRRSRKLDKTNIRLLCTGVGRYTLNGPWPSNRECVLVDSAFLRNWEIALSKGSTLTAENPQPGAELSRTRPRPGSIDRRIVKCYTELLRMFRRMRMMPCRIVKTWCKDVPRDWSLVATITGYPQLQERLGDLLVNEWRVKRMMYGHYVKV